MGYPESRPSIPNDTNFKFCEKPIVEGLIPGHLDNFYDIVKKWGKINQKRNLVDFESGYIDMGFEINIVMRTGTDQRLFMMISKKSIVMTPISIPVQSGDQIFWDSNLSSKEAEKAIRRIDEIAGSKGLVDQKTGERIVSKEAGALQPWEVFPRLSVEVLKRKKGMIVKVRNNEDPREDLKRFDHPEFLCIYQHALYGAVIGLKADEDYIKLYDNSLRKTLRDLRIDINNKARLEQILRSELTMRVIELLVSKKMPRSDTN